MLSLLQNQVVVEHQWISESTFTDIVAISQMTPGPIGINSATYTGYSVLFNATGSHMLGVLGSATATFAMRPAVAGLIGAAAVILIIKTTWTGGIPTVQVVSENFPDWKSWCLLGGAFAASYWGKVNPIYVIIAAAFAGILLY